MKSVIRHRRPIRASATTTITAADRSSVDGLFITWVRDRALDHAVEKERNLKPMLNLKTLINSEPSKSLPLSIITQQRAQLQIPTRPTEFIRNYPSVFQEFLPGGIGINPHIKLTQEVLDLDAEEQLIYGFEDQKHDVANRLLKLLMIGRVNKIPLSVIDLLKFDLGLPNDYVETLVPEFPDYFQVSGDDLELVCWSNELAVSSIERKNTNFKKGDPISFPVQYSRGFEMDKKFTKSVDDFQKLPYISPYEKCTESGDGSDKWVVSVVHEVLNLLVPKKSEKDNILKLGEHLGIRSGMKRALLYHPGIFYISSKLRTHTVVLREAYKRDLLIGKHPLMDMRSKYIHLMFKMKEDTSGKKKSGKKKARCSANGGQMDNFDDDEDEDDDEDDNDDEEEDVDDDDDDEGEIDNNVDEAKGKTENSDAGVKGNSRNVPKRGRTARNSNGGGRKGRGRSQEKNKRRTSTS